MKKNKIIIMLFIMIFAFSVKANEWWEVYTTIEKSEDASELYNLMPTEVKKGETISVKLVVKKGNGLKLSNLDSEITWDKEAFELIETNGKYYRELKKDVECNIYFGKSENSVNLHCYFNENSTISDSEDIIELKFKAKNNVNDGIYEIKQNYNNDGIGISTDDDYKTSISTDKQLKYQVGKPKLISEYANENIENSSYIIGDYLFTRKGSDEYNGILTTDYIMLASPSIRSKNKEDMIVYAKNARGKWINAITNESITPPEEFKISYIDMIANYRENGVYSDGSYKTKLGLVQINENEAIIIIESTDEKIHGIASIKDRVATLNVNKKNYIITISDNEVNIETNDNYIGNKKLLKRANYSVNDYYDDYYSYRNEYGGSRYYLNSSHTGKYVNNNYEIYIYRISDSCSKICLKKRNESECIIDTLQFTNYYNEIEFDGIPSTYEFGLEETQYGVLIEENGLRIKSIGNSESPYQGTYKKESSLSMDEIFHIWEKNEVYYRVEFDENNEYQEIYYEYILENSELGDWSYFYPYKEGYDFIGWFLNDEQYYVDSIITKPITLVAAYQIKSYSVDFDTNGGTSINTIIIPHGGRILRPDDPIKEGHTFVGWQLNGQDYNFNTPVTDNITLTAKYDKNKYTVTFNSDGGTNVASQNILYGEKAVKPTNPTKAGYTFKEWQLNGQAYVFDTPITSNITLKAKWVENETANSLKGTWNISGEICKESYMDITPFEFTDEVLNDILNNAINYEDDEKIVINTETTGHLYMDGLEYYTITINDGRMKYDMINHNNVLVNSYNIKYMLKDNYLITFGPDSCLRKYSNSANVISDDIDYQVPSGYNNVNVNSVIQEYHLDKIENSISNNEELFKKYAYITLNNNNIPALYKEALLDFFVVIANNKKILNEKYFLYHFSKLKITEKNSEYVKQVCKDSNAAGCYITDEIFISNQSLINIIYHELMHFMDDRIDSDVSKNWNMKYLTYNGKLYNLETANKLGIKRFEVVFDTIYLKFITEGGAEYYNAKYFLHNVGSAYRNYFTYIEILEKIIGEEELEKIFFSPNTSELLIEQLINKIGINKVNELIEILIRMSNTDALLTGFDFFVNIIDLCNLFNIKWYENEDIHLIVDREWEYQFYGETEESLISNEFVNSENIDYLRELLNHYNHENFERVYIDKILNEYHYWEIFDYRIMRENNDVYIYIMYPVSKYEAEFYQFKIDMANKQIVSAVNLGSSKLSGE